MQNSQLCAARPSSRTSIPYPETLKEKILASEYFAESQVLVEDMFIQEIMESAQYCLERNKPSRVQLLLQEGS